MPDPIDLSTTSAITQALAQAIDLRAHIRAGYVPDAEQLAWLADIACAALLLAEPADLDLIGYLSAVDDILALPLPELPAPPPWLRRMQEDFNA
jgi:hypothetical protein